MTAMACLVAPRLTPSLLAVLHLVRSYISATSLGTTYFTKSVIESIAATHTPFSNMKHGIPWFCNMDPFICRYIRGSVPSNLRRSS